jgi:hypothetical protein
MVYQKSMGLFGLFTRPPFSSQLFFLGRLSAEVQASSYLTMGFDLVMLVVWLDDYKNTLKSQASLELTFSQVE